MTIYFPDGTSTTENVADHKAGHRRAFELLGPTSSITVDHLPGTVIYFSDVASNRDGVAALVGKEQAKPNEQLMTWYALSQGVECEVYGPAVLVR
jgi:hypothetical protein